MGVIRFYWGHSLPRTRVNVRPSNSKHGDLANASVFQRLAGIKRRGLVVIASAGPVQHDIHSSAPEHSLAIVPPSLLSPVLDTAVAVEPAVGNDLIFVRRATGSRDLSISVILEPWRPALGSSTQKVALIKLVIKQLPVGGPVGDA